MLEYKERERERDMFVCKVQAVNLLMLLICLRYFTDVMYNVHIVLQCIIYIVFIVMYVGTVYYIPLYIYPSHSCTLYYQGIIKHY